jgi:hypothetical protein
MIIANHPIIFNTPKRLIEVSSWITHSPFAFFLISILRPKVVVELGVFSGQSYAAFCQAVRTLKLDTQCYGIDTWKGDVQIGEYGEEVYEEFSNHNQKEYGEFSQLLRMTFNEALTNFKDGSIDLLHIDGFHTYDEVKNDFESWLPKMSPSGVVVFHDTFIKDLDFGVWKLWEEISQKYPSFEFVHGYGLGVAAVGKEVNKDFIEFLREANAGGYISKLFSALGQLAFSEARINSRSGACVKLKDDCVKLKGDYDNYKAMIADSSEWQYGIMTQRLIRAIAPDNTWRRKTLQHLVRKGIAVVKRLEGPSRNIIHSEAPVAKVCHVYDEDTLRSIKAMPLPSFENGKRKCAIFVMVKNESVFLPIWLKYYSRYIDGKDIYVFDHRSIDGSVERCLKDYKFNVIQLNYSLSFDHLWFQFVADTVQKKLLHHYEYVIFTDVDEIILPDVNKYRGLDDYIQKLDKNYVRCIGYELIHVPHKEKPYDASESVLSQRRFWYYTHWYNKTLISNQPLNWEIGFHEVPNLESDFDRDLMLIHLHKLDFDLCFKNSFERARLKWPLEDIINNRGWQNRLTDIDKFRDYYEGWPDNFKIEEIPEELRKSNIF